MKLISKPTYEELSVEAAGIVADTLRSNPRANLCLAAGKTPLGMYRELVQRHHRHAIDFQSAGMFHLDEYVGLKEGHPGSFQSYLKREFFDHIDVPGQNIHFITEDYERVLRDAGGIDLLIAGLGRNGHLAFNEPGSSFSSRTRRVKLAPSTLEDMRQTFEPDALPQEAVTVGLATIMDARKVLLLVSGSGKSEILAKVLTGPIEESTPASLLRLHQDSTVIADNQALTQANVTSPAVKSS